MRHDEQLVLRMESVVAFGGAGVAEFGNLAVNRFEIRFRQLLVAIPALVDHLELKGILIGANDSMRFMAIGAIGQPFVGMADGGRVDAVDELFIDAVVAFGARFGDVLVADTRIRIGLRQFMMGRMAVGAHGRYHQTALQQSLAVNTHRIKIGHRGFAPLRSPFRGHAAGDVAVAA